MSKPVLILGGTSAIARHAAYGFAEKGHSLYLAGRDEDELMRIAQDCHIRYGVDVKTGFFDAEDIDNHELFVQRVVREMDELEGVLLAFGYLGDHDKAVIDFGEAERIIACNFVGACSVLTHCADYFEKRESGFIVGITSVAGDRGRQSNYVYGAAKGGLNVFLQGLRNRLSHSNVQVVTVKPGFVDTAMTFGKSGMFLVASPEVVGKKIVKAVYKRRNQVYVPWYWYGIMAVVRNIPEGIFKRMKL